MAQDPKQPSSVPQAPAAGRARKPYAKPRLVRYGDVRDLTLGTGATMNEGTPGSMMT